MRLTTPWPWLAAVAAIVAANVAARGSAQVTLCADLLLHEERIECWLSDIAASTLATTGAASFLADAGPTVGVLGAAMVAVILTRWYGHG